MSEITFFGILVSSKALDNHSLEKDVAEEIKRAIDNESEFNMLPGKGPWHCIVGRSFGGAVTHEREFVLLFDILSYGQTVRIIYFYFYRFFYSSPRQCKNFD